ncbi:MAG: hypothetical protein J6C23_06845 [Clostridia bacterium]|nr:hypothetical protein [Clostridia bacterium]
MKHDKKQYEEDIVREVRADYENRARLRRPYEAQWQLNSNFVMGNQYCYVNIKGDVEDSEKDYFWQEREVFNHVATVIESRLSKLSSVRPKLVVQPASGDDKDVKSAKVSSKILDSAYHTLDLDRKISRATMWSELTGTAFYKTVWNSEGGKCVGEDNGEKIYEGDVKVDVCPPYEIYPDDVSHMDIEECTSIIHAKALPVDEIYRVWGKRVKSERLNTLSTYNVSLLGGLGNVSAVTKMSNSENENYALVIERYTKPTSEKKDGELVIVAGDTLLYIGTLSCSDGKPVYPFVKQTCIDNPGCFYGISMVERCIPVQRAYNAVKNRKHEFMNRIAMGVLAVEDGSVDTRDLEEEGLGPGKILIYRQGSNPPRLLDPGSVPNDFTNEENRLLTEFAEVSGISDIMRSSTVPSTVTSGTAIQMLIEQDNTRINITAQSLKNAVKDVAHKILALYRKNACFARLSRFVGEEGDVELISWSASDLSSDDIVFGSVNEISGTVASKQNTMFELLRSGLLHDGNGKLPDATRRKILDVFGYGGWEQTQYVNSLHSTRAERENYALSKKPLTVSEIDDHLLHVEEHTKFMLSSDFDSIRERDPSLEEKMLDHIRKHKQYHMLTKQTEAQYEGQTNG